MGSSLLRSFRVLPELALHRAVSHYDAHDPRIPQQLYHAIPRLSDTGHCSNLSGPLSHHLQPKKPSFEFLCIRGDNTGPEQPAESLQSQEWRMDAGALRLHLGLMHPFRALPSAWV